MVNDRFFPPERGILSPMSNDRIKELEKRIEDLKRRWPAHSVPPALLQQLDELEEALEEERRRARQADEAEHPAPSA